MARLVLHAATVLRVVEIVADVRRDGVDAVVLVDGVDRVVVVVVDAVPVVVVVEAGGGSS